MRVKGMPPQELTLQLLKRSGCKVQVASVISDKRGAFAWAVNHAGDGFGMCAERECLRRANPKRVAGAVLWVAARRRKSKGIVTAMPCAACAPAVKGCLYVMYRDKNGTWVRFK